MVKEIDLEKIPPPFNYFTFTDSIMMDHIATKAKLEWTSWLSRSEDGFLLTVQGSPGCGDFIRWVTDDVEFCAHHLGSAFLYANKHIIRDILAPCDSMVRFAAGGTLPDSIPAPIKSKMNPEINPAIGDNLFRSARRVAYDGIGSSIRFVFNKEVKYWSLPEDVWKATQKYRREGSFNHFTNEMLTDLQQTCFTRTLTNARGEQMTYMTVPYKRNHPLRTATGLGVYHLPIDNSDTYAAIVTSSFNPVHGESPSEILSTLYFKSTQMPRDTKLMVLSMCTLLCAILATYRTKSVSKHDPQEVRDSRAAEQKNLIHQIQALSNEIQRIIYCYADVSKGTPLINMEPYPQHRIMSNGKINNVRCERNCIELADKKAKINTGLTLHMHGTLNLGGQKEVETEEELENGIADEDNMDEDFDERAFSQWGFCAEERRMFFASRHEDVCLLFHGDSNLWVLNPPIISLNLSKTLSSNHIIFLRDTLAPVNVAHVNILGATSEMARIKYPSDPRSCFLITEHKSETPAELLKKAHPIRKTHLTLLVCKLPAYDQIVRVITKRICADAKGVFLESMNLHFWIPMSWVECEAFIDAHSNSWEVQLYMKAITMNGALKVHFAVCPPIDEISEDEKEVFGGYNEHRSQRTKLEFAGQMHAFFRQRYNDEAVLRELHETFVPIDEGSMAYREVQYMSYEGL